MITTEHLTTGAPVETLGLIHRVHVTEASQPRSALVMVHGLNGNEDVTWIFARNAPPDCLIISPRAPFGNAEEGYRWNETKTNGYTDYNNPDILTDGLSALSRFIQKLPEAYPVDPRRITLLGFSQGAAMSYAYAAAHPTMPVRGIAALSGFVPAMVRDLSVLRPVPVLILHGTQDETIQIQVAHQDRDRLIAAGVDVTYHEAEVGHKISTSGMAELKRWLAAR